jgi:predicted HTH domain antitoxin
LTRVRAASLLGLSLDAFLSEASKHGLDAIAYDLDDFRRELASGP